VVDVVVDVVAVDVVDVVDVVADESSTTMIDKNSIFIY